ncbi:putative Ubiquitin C-terminal hydrolase 12 [Blattamonas nauphoetae]|uniref:Ubiquitin C-terminal hydrolase 12 n=1 Tax=Blattamonas nauphoetae TaxID=2049346 RepID=A0ABQ9X141_9EUKA|nr:putative Ubiquitin C-terminal hydrolase 12 [Blattamonas nauphoetae]
MGCGCSSDGATGTFSSPHSTSKGSDEAHGIVVDLDIDFNAEERMKSETFTAFGLDWCIYFFPQVKAPEYFIAYLSCESIAHLDENLTLTFFFSITLHNKHKTQTITKEGATYFSPKSPLAGLRNFISVSKLNGKDGFIVDGKLHFTVQIRPTLDEKLTTTTPSATRAKTGFIGITNLGNTCYLNSLMQTLYHTSLFRWCIYHFPIDDMVDTAFEQRKLQLHGETIPKMAEALQRFFFNLQTSPSVVTTTELTRSFGWSARDSFYQHDVNELNRVLLDNLMTKLADTPFRGCINNLLEIRSLITTKCVDVDYVSRREEILFDISLPVKGFTSIYEALDDYSSVTKLDGDNKYKTEQFGYQDAERSTKFTQLPPVLHFQLMRWTFDFNTQQMKKANDWFEFPEELDMSPYVITLTDEEKAQMEEKKRLEEEEERKERDEKEAQKRASSASPDLPITPQKEIEEKEEKELPPLSPEMQKMFEGLETVKDHKYTLHSVLVHKGSLQNGHYYAYIQPKCDGNWFCFNDETVSQCPSDHAIESTYGEKPDNLSMGRTVGSAYMLVYVRTESIPKVLVNVKEDDIPSSIRETLVAQSEAKLKMTFKVFTEDILKKTGDLVVPSSAAIHLVVFRNSSFADFKQVISEKTNIPIELIRIWTLRTRKEKEGRKKHFPTISQTSLVPFGHTAVSGPENNESEIMIDTLFFGTINAIYVESHTSSDSTPSATPTQSTSSPSQAIKHKLTPSLRRVSTKPKLTEQLTPYLVVVREFDPIHHTFTVIGAVSFLSYSLMSSVFPQIKDLLQKSRENASSPTEGQSDNPKPVALTSTNDPVSDDMNDYTLFLSDGHVKKASSWDGPLAKFKPGYEMVIQYNRHQAKDTAWMTAREYQEKTDNLITFSVSVDSDNVQPFEIEMDGRRFYTDLATEIANHIGVKPTHLKLWRTLRGFIPIPMSPDSKDCIGAISDQHWNSPKLRAPFTTTYGLIARPLKVPVAEFDKIKTVDLIVRDQGTTILLRTTVSVPMEGTVVTLLNATREKMKEVFPDGLTWAGQLALEMAKREDRVRDQIEERKKEQLRMAEEMRKGSRLQSGTTAEDEVDEKAEGKKDEKHEEMADADKKEDGEKGEVEEDKQQQEDKEETAQNKDNGEAKEEGKKEEEHGEESKEHQAEERKEERGENEQTHQESEPTDGRNGRAEVEQEEIVEHETDQDESVPREEKGADQAKKEGEEAYDEDLERLKGGGDAYSDHDGENDRLGKDETEIKDGNQAMEEKEEPKEEKEENEGKETNEQTKNTKDETENEEEKLNMTDEDQKPHKKEKEAASPSALEENVEENPNEPTQQNIPDTEREKEDDIEGDENEDKPNVAFADLAADDDQNPAPVPIGTDQTATPQPPNRHVLVSATTGISPSSPATPSVVPSTPTITPYVPIDNLPHCTPIDEIPLRLVVLTDNPRACAFIYVPTSSLVDVATDFATISVDIPPLGQFRTNSHSVRMIPVCFVNKVSKAIVDPEQTFFVHCSRYDTRPDIVARIRAILSEKKDAQVPELQDLSYRTTGMTIGKMSSISETQCGLNYYFHQILIEVDTPAAPSDTSSIPIFTPLRSRGIKLYC